MENVKDFFEKNAEAQVCYTAGSFVFRARNYAENYDRKSVKVHYRHKYIEPVITDESMPEDVCRGLKEDGESTPASKAEDIEPSGSQKKKSGRIAEPQK